MSQKCLGEVRDHPRPILVFSGQVPNPFRQNRLTNDYYRSEGFALTGYVVPGCVEDGAWMLRGDYYVAAVLVAVLARRFLDNVSTTDDLLPFVMTTNLLLGHLF